MATRVEDLLTKILAALEGSPSGLSGEFAAGRARTPGGAGTVGAGAVGDAAKTSDAAAYLAQLKEIDALEEKMNQRSRALARQLDRVNSSMDRRILQYDQELIKLDLKIEKAQITLGDLEDEYNKQVAILLALEQQEQKDEAALATAKEDLALAKQALKNQQTAIEKEIERAENLELSQNATRGIVEETESLLNQMGLSGRAYDQGIFGKLEDLGGGNLFKGLEAGAKALGSALGSALNPANLMASALSQIYQTTVSMIGAQDRALASFQRQTGAGVEYNDVIREVREQTFSYGVTIDEAQEAVMGLYTTFSDFSTLSKEARINIAAFTAKMGNFGLSAEETGELLNTMTKSLHMSVDQAEGAIEQAVASAKALGMPVAQYSRALRESMPQLAAYGKSAIGVFNKMSAVAKATGIEVNKLTQTFALQFDTFESSAKMVSQVNAQLGGPFLNSMTLMSKVAEGPAEAMIYLRQQLSASGKSWESMGFFAKKAMAAAMGTDVDTLGKFMAGSAADMEELMAKQEEAAAHQAMLAEQAEIARPAQEKLTAALQQLAIAVQPLVDIMHFFLDSVLIPITDFLGDFTVPTIVLLVGVYKGWTAAIKANAAVTAAQMELTIADAAVQTGAAGAKELQTAASVKLTAAEQARAGQMGVFNILAAPFIALHAGMTAALTAMGFSAAFAGQMVRLGLVAALAALVYIIAIETHSPVLWILLGVVAAGILGIGFAAAAASPMMAAAAVPMKAFGIGLSLIGVGVALVGAGILMMGHGIAAVIESMTGLVQVMLEASDSLLPFALALPLVGIGGVLAMFGLVAMGIGFAALGLGLKLVSTDDLQALAMMFQGIGKAAEAGGTGMSGVIAPLAAFASAADDIDDDVVEEMTNMFEKLSKTKISPEMASFGTIFEQVSQFESAASNVDLFRISLEKLSVTMSNMSTAMAELSLMGSIGVSLMFSQIASVAEAGTGAAQTFEAASTFVRSAATVSPESVDSTKELLEALASAAEDVNDAGGADELVKVVAELTGVLREATGGRNQDDGKPIVLSMDRSGREILAKGIIDHLVPLIDKKLDIRT